MNEKQKKVMVGMSGGIDSSVTAYMLQKEGYEVEGIYLKLHNRTDGYHEGNLGYIDDVAKFLDIKYHILDLANEFSKVLELNVKPTFTRFDDSRVLSDGLGQALTFDESLEELGKKELYQMLTQNGVKKQYAYSFIENRSIV